MSYIKNYWVFFGSLFLGVFLWSITFVVLPLKNVEPVKAETIFYIVSGYLAVISGFIAFNFKNKQNSKQSIELSKILTVLLIIIFISYIIRWIDLFYIRELSFNIASKNNRVINDNNYGNSSILFLLASITKSIYFFPFVLILSSKIKQKHSLVFASYAVLLFPLVEALLKGTRKPFFELFIIILFTLVMYQRKKLNLKKVIWVILGFVILMTLSMMILINRESKPSQDNNFFYTKLLESRYNDLLAPKDNVKTFFDNPDTPDTPKFYAMAALHTGQYITHGVFEFNHIVGYKDLPVTYGKYTFMAIPKFINKTKLFNNIEITNPSPRQYVYLSFFGDFYIDFRWGLIPFMFLFGMVQKYTFQKAEYNSLYNPILIYFLIINVFLLVINYIRAAGIYPFFGFCFILAALQLSQLITYEKGSNT